MATAQPARRRWMVVSLAVGIVALACGAGFQLALGDEAGDRLTPTDVRVDARVVVVVFPSGAAGAGTEVAHLRATYYRDIATVAVADGARAIALVDFDSQAFSDGGAGRRNVIGSQMLQEAGVGPLLDPAITSSPNGLPVLTSYRVDPLASELAGVGVPAIDGGGVLRTVPALARLDRLDDGAIVEVPPFAFDAADRAAQTVVPGLALRLVELGTGQVITQPATDSFVLGSTVVPLEDGSLRIRWSSGLDRLGDPQVVQFGDFAAAPPGFFQDAVVLVGTVDPAKTTFIDTPLGPLPPVLVEANAVNTLLSGDFQEPASPWWAWLAAAVGLAGILAVQSRRWWLVASVAVAASVAWLLIVRAAAGRGDLLLALFPAAAFLTAAVLLGVIGQVDVVMERRRIRSLFAQYVPRSVAEQLVASGRGEVASHGERVAVTTLFCDLRGFTPIASRLDPGQVRELLNTYYEQLAHVVLDEGGTVLQYTGDEIFGVFGAPLPQTDHAQAALRCARRLFAALEHLNDTLLQRALPALNFGIGLHSGDVVAAHVGSSARMQYTVIGDTVNVGSRHCSLAREGQIAVSAVTEALAGPIDDARREDGVELKGVASTQPVFFIQAGPTVASGSPELVKTGSPEPSH